MKVTKVPILLTATEESPMNKKLEEQMNKDEIKYLKVKYEVNLPKSKVIRNTLKLIYIFERFINSFIVNEDFLQMKDAFLKK